MRRKVPEAVVVFLIGAVQLVNVLDFVMVMPLGPDFAEALGIPLSKLGLVAGSYTAAAAVSGVLGSTFLDRFDRRTVLGVAIVGLVAGTFAGGLARGLGTLLLARIVAGAFGGPATSVALAIVADVVPPERRGKAMGSVMVAFSVAAVLGVPAALELARRAGWRAPFLAVGALGLLVAIASVVSLPSLRGHLARAPQGSTWAATRRLLSQPEVRISYAMTFTAMVANFIVIPNLSAYVQQNLGCPREQLGYLYMAGGIASFLAIPLAGRLVDRFGSFKVGTAGVLALSAILYTGFIDYAGIPLVALFVAFMSAMALRNVSYNTLTSKVPRPEDRARFMSLQSAVQHVATSIGAVASAQLLSDVGGKLEGIPLVAGISIGLTLILPFLLWRVERRVTGRLQASFQLH